jgi:hypothetical protein
VKRADNGCSNNNAVTARPRTSGNITNHRSSRGCSTGAVDMNSFVVVFVPCDEMRRDIEAALSKHVDPTEFAEKPADAPTRTIEDAEELPLWRWFISSK